MKTLYVKICETQLNQHLRNMRELNMFIRKQKELKLITLQNNKPEDTRRIK